MIEIIRSFTRKIQLEHIGGNRFESVDIFASYKQTDIPTGTSKEDLEMISEGLYLMSKHDVEKCITNYTNELKK